MTGEYLNVQVRCSAVRDETDWLTPTELAAWIGLIKLSARLVAISDAELRRETGITGRDYELLHELSGEPDGARISDLAHRIDDSSSCITHRVNRLAAAGLVSKQVDAVDARARRVAVTPAGRSLLEEAAPRHVARVRRWVFDALDDDDVAELGRLTAMLREQLRRVAPLGA
jgi:DNA-binding MarR family transcriptional regulator